MTQEINLTDICEKANWHRLTAIEALMAEGLERRDAGAFVDFVFNDHAKITDYPSEECVTDEQYKRLDLDTDMNWILKAAAQTP